MTRFQNGQEVGITSNDVNWFTQTGGDLMTPYDWWQHKNDDWLDGCLDVLKVTANEMCNFDQPWSQGNWHGLGNDTHGDRHELDLRRLSQMDQIQGAYKEHLRAQCRANSNSNPSCDTDNEHSLNVMCVNAHAAELVVDQLAVLGVGCPLPKPKYVPPPPKPCWFGGEHNCPDPVLEKCDVIAREMETISGQVSLNAGMAKCFSQRLKANTLESKLRYFCVARGVWENKGDKTLRQLDQQDWKKRRLVHDLGVAQYHNNNDLDGQYGKPAYLQKVKEQLHKLKRMQDSEDELDWWNGANGVGTPTPTTEGVSDVTTPGDFQ